MSVARTVKLRGWPITATLGPMTASSGGSLADSELMTKVRVVDSASALPCPSPSSVAISVTTKSPRSRSPGAMRSTPVPAVAPGT